MGHTDTMIAENAARAANAPLLKTVNLHRVLGTAEAPAHVLRGVDLSIEHRGYVSIVGASGSGKSTLLYLLGGLDRPSMGMQVNGDMQRFDPAPMVFVDGQNTSELDDGELAQLRNEKIGFVFQFHYLLREFSAQENVCLPMWKHGRWSRSEAADRAEGLLKRLGLGDKLTRRTNRLSGGEQQRVAIARALANEPAALLADEPTGNLDRANGERVAEIFSELAAAGQAIVMVTHDTQLAHRADRMIRMEDGQIVEDNRLR